MLWNVLVHLWFLKPIFCNIFSHVERRNVASCYHGCKISVSQQTILAETAICIVEWRKKSMGYPFVPECNRAEDRSHACQLFCFFYHIFRTMVCWDPEILLPWQCDITTAPIHYNSPFFCPGTLQYFIWPPCYHESFFLFLSRQSSVISLSCCQPQKYNYTLGGSKGGFLYIVPSL